MAALSTTNTFFSRILEQILGSKDFKFTTNQENFIPHIKKLSSSVLATILMERGFDPKNPIPDADIIKSCKDILFENMNSAEVEDLPEGGYMVHFNLRTGGKLFFKTYRTRPATHREKKYFQKILRGEVYRSIVQPDPTLLPTLIEFYINDILDDYDTYEKYNK